MNTGKIFESEIKDSLDEWNKNNRNDIVYYHRIPDPPQSFNQDSNGLRFSNKNPYDIFIVKTIDWENKIGSFIALELKSKKINSLSFNLDKNIKGTFDIKYHQIQGLKEVYDKGGKAFFLFNFRKENLTYKICINNFLKFVESTDKKSINIKDIIEFGGILIPQELKKIKYRYDVSKIWE